MKNNNVTIAFIFPEPTPTNVPEAQQPAKFIPKPNTNEPIKSDIPIYSSLGFTSESLSNKAFASKVVKIPDKNVPTKNITNIEHITIVAIKFELSIVYNVK